MKNQSNKKLYNTKPIYEYINKHKMTKTEFCKRCGITPYILSNVFKNKPIKISSAIKIIKILDIRMNYFLGIDNIKHYRK